MTSFFFHDFLMISRGLTVVFLIVLVLLFVIMRVMEKRKASFARRVLVATGIGLVLGLAIQFVAGFPAQPMEETFIVETTKWLGLVGNGFIALVRMLVIPLIMVSIIHVIINMQGNDLGRLAKTTIAVTMIMVMISVVVGLGLAVAFRLGTNFAAPAAVTPDTAIKDVHPVADTLLALLPANPVAAMVETNIIALVIFSAFLGAATMRMSKKYANIVKPFADFINAFQKIILSVAMYVIRLMPYAVIAMLANTIAQRGIQGILEVALFIAVLYLGLAVVFIIQMLLLAVHGLNPFTYVRKGFDPMIMAFTSRSSVGTLPVTIGTLTHKLGVSEGTANFVASFNSTAGMQGCAGVFPAMLVVFVSNLGGTPVNATFLVMVLIVISIGSLGIAGIPGTATMAASVALSGTGMAASFPLISPILAIDPIIDMGRSCINVTGAMTNAIVVDKRLGRLDAAAYGDMGLARGPDETAAAMEM
ncbi:MAG: cation:dicarboxylase symporter family transporter [Planctomycetaceae bacterium]|nr:cation:dicarboxylase symporter family transporter [Planctomycetaceae bacterium]